MPTTFTSGPMSAPVRTPPPPPYPLNLFALFHKNRAQKSEDGFTISSL